VDAGKVTVELRFDQGTNGGRLLNYKNSIETVFVEVILGLYVLIIYSSSTNANYFWNLFVSVSIIFPYSKIVQ